MNKCLEKYFTEAAEKILSLPEDTRVRIISHYDADGISAAAIMCKAVQRAGLNFHATLMRNPFDKGLVRLSKEENDFIIFTDMGSGQIEAIEKMNAQSIIIDHHQPIKEKTSDNVYQINCNLCKVNGNYEACGATMAFGVAYAMNSGNIDLASLALVGATGDKQYIGGFRGYNKDVVDEAVKTGIIKEKTGIKFSDDTIFYSLFYSVDPYYSDISGNKKGILELLERIGVDKDKKIENLTSDEIKKINSYLMLKLIKKGCEKNILDTVIRSRFYSENIDFEFERFADILDSCGKGGNRSLGLSSALGDKKTLAEASQKEKEYKQKILDELIRLEKEGFMEKNGFRYFYSKDSSLGGVIGGIATNFMLDAKKPLISIAKNDGEIHVSCRGNQHLVSKGLDLGKAMKEASTTIGGHGGGHAIASGATIDGKKEEEFLKLVDEIIVKQLKS